MGGQGLEYWGVGGKGGPNSQQAHDVILTSMRRNDVVSMSFRRHVPTRFLRLRLCNKRYYTKFSAMDARFCMSFEHKYMSRNTGTGNSFKSRIHFQEWLDCPGKERVSEEICSPLQNSRKTHTPRLKKKMFAVRKDKHIH